MTASTITAPAKSARSLTTGQKFLASAAAVGAVAALFAGTFGAFGNSTSASQKFETGSAGIDMPYSTISAPISGLLPGDSTERVATLTNTGTSNLESIKMTATPVTSSALTTDPTNGLQLAIDACNVPWRTVAGAADACDGSQWPVLASTPVATLTPGMPLNVASIAAGQTDHLRATFKLPDTADSTFQNLAAETNFQFDGVQRAGTFID